MEHKIHMPFPFFWTEDIVTQLSEPFHHAHTTMSIVDQKQKSLMSLHHFFGLYSDSFQSQVTLKKLQTPVIVCDIDDVAAMDASLMQKIVSAGDLRNCLQNWQHNP